MPAAPPTLLRTDRLVLRRWRGSDLEPFAALNADPEVMRYFPHPLSRTEGDALVERTEATFGRLGHGLWAVERQDTSAFIGFVGLAPMHPGSPGAGGVEVGWRLASSVWGQGFATEAARASISDGIRRLGLDEIWSWTAVLNTPSQAVMRRLGMREHSRSMHPDLPAGHPLTEHVTCRVAAADVS
ncbi:GNAT family N-acetyltransferase [Knoellia locipacati]|uniref:GNAT family N-acetyltransferase n=1 Tax=Knoellia locipacati TaxID=882824 RepID=UPI003850EF5B